MIAHNHIPVNNHALFLLAIFKTVNYNVLIPFSCKNVYPIYHCKSRRYTTIAIGCSILRPKKRTHKKTTTLLPRFLIFIPYSLPLTCQRQAGSLRYEVKNFAQHPSKSGICRNKENQHLNSNLNAGLQ